MSLETRLLKLVSELPNPEPFRYPKRSTILPTPLENADVSYQVKFALGSNQQQFSAVLDTGSSDTWVPAPNASCFSCTSDGTFNSETSTSYKNLGRPLNISYGDGSSTLGEFATDVLHIDGVTLNNFEFVIANETSVQRSGIFGISSIDQESTNKSGNFTYTNFPALLKQEGIIAKNAYSLYLNEASAQTGSMIFGGVDHAKYDGSLTTSQIDGYPYLGIAWQGITTANGSTIQNSGKPIVLDSGTSSSGFPTSIINQIYAELNDTYNEFFWTAPCDQGGKNFTFALGEGTISVPYSSFLYDPIKSPSDCLILELFDTTKYKVDILGDIFLRSANVVYDLDDRTISYAQAVYTDESDISPL